MNNVINMVATSSTLYKYSGYLKIKGYNASSIDSGSGKAKLLIDGINIVKEDITSRSEFEFKGYVKDSIYLEDYNNFQFIFEEFSTNPYEDYFDITKDFYNINALPEKNNLLLGELIIKSVNHNSGMDIDWYNAIEDLETEKMQIWNTSLINPSISWNPGQSKIWYNLSDLGSAHARPSGYMGLSTTIFEDFPILIYKEDIGKINYIGSFRNTDGTKTSIKLTIK